MRKLQPAASEKVESRHVSAGESWAEEVYKYSFSHEDEGPLGELYIDPIARQVMPAQPQLCCTCLMMRERRNSSRLATAFQKRHELKV